MARPITSVLEMKQANETAGKYWFSPDTMRAFRSRILSPLWPVKDGTIFVTGEDNFNHTRRMYSIRFIHNGAGVGPRGIVDDISTFGEYSTARTAKRHAARLAYHWTGWREA